MKFYQNKMFSNLSSNLRDLRVLALFTDLEKCFIPSAHNRALTTKVADILTVEVGGDGVPGQEAVDGNLIDDVQQQEGHTGEAEGLQQTPCVA